jgi:site-specific DNA recombinase
VLWCAQCEHRFIVQRAVGNGGKYFYFFCRGRQEGVCDAPYLNVHAVEQAVVSGHYATVSFSDEFTAAVRARLDEALAKEKLIAIRDERAGIQRDIQRLDAEVDTGRAVFGPALDLLDQPRELYRQAGPALRKTMNQTIFTKLRLDGTAVAADELAEPFDVIVLAGRAYERRSYQRKRPPVAWSGLAFYEGGSADDLTSTDLLELALGDTSF